MATTPTPIADSLPEPSTGPIPTEQTRAEWQPDVAALSSAKGDPAVWAHQFSELVGHTTGQWIEDSVFQEWLSLFAGQVSIASARTALVSVANAPTRTSGGDALASVLDFRDNLVAGFRKAAGI